MNFIFQYLTLYLLERPRLHLRQVLYRQGRQLYRVQTDQVHIHMYTQVRKR
jgi:hypothetical protein